MSLEDNRNIVRRYQEAYNTGDFTARAEAMANDVCIPLPFYYSIDQAKSNIKGDLAHE